MVRSRSSFLTTTSLCLHYVSLLRGDCIPATSLNHIAGPEIWNVDNGLLSQQGKAAVIDDSFLDVKSPKGSASNTPARSRLQSPASSTNGTPAASGDEDSAGGRALRKKKKPTRNTLKAQEERRRLRKLAWLTHGGDKPEDTDEEMLV